MRRPGACEGGDRDKVYFGVVGGNGRLGATFEMRTKCYSDILTPSYG